MRRKLLFPILLILLYMWHADAYAQQETLPLQIDAEGGQPFVVKIGEKSFASSPEGHAMIPALKDSTYLVVIRTEGNKAQALSFSVSLNDRARLLELRNLPDKGWELFNTMTSEEILPKSGTAPVASLNNGAKKEDAFAQLMAAVVNDTAVLYNSYAEMEAADSAGKSEASLRKQAPDTAALAKPEKTKAAAPSPKGAPVAAARVKSPAIKKLNQHKTTTDLWVKYLVYAKSGGVDTVTLSIPLEAKANDSARGKSLSAGKAKKSKGTDSAAFPAVDSSAQAPADQKKALSQPDCTNVAKDNDVDALRVQILSANTEDEKIAAAKKTFKTTCFSTQQIRALSELFVNDKGRFRLYEAAYPYVTDRDQYGQLSGTLSDPQYLSALKALTGQ